MTHDGCVEGLVSVILPVFNRPEMLPAAVDCVAAQTYKHLELILVNDGSSDDTGKLCDRLSSERAELVRVIHRENGGPGAARESGRRAARGEFLQYLDSDDWIDPRKLAIQVAALRRERRADIAYCRTTETTPGREGRGSLRSRTDEPRSSVFPDFLSGRLWHTISPLYRSSMTNRMGPWTELRQEEDLEYDARAGALGAWLVYCPESLAEHRHHLGERAGGGSEGNPTKMRWRFESHRLVYAHARRAGVASDDPNMQVYARELFHLARQCGAAGLPEEAKELFELALEASGEERRRGSDFRAYAVLAALVGWSAAGSLSCRVDVFRKPRTDGPA